MGFPKGRRSDKKIGFFLDSVHQQAVHITVVSRNSTFIRRSVNVNAGPDKAGSKTGDRLPSSDLTPKSGTLELRHTANVEASQ